MAFTLAWRWLLSLLLIAFLGVPAFGAIAPIGGVLMIAGWLCLAFAAVRS